MENKTNIIKHYLNNGKVAQNHLVKSTPIKSTKIKNINTNNGKIFTKELVIAFEKNNVKKLTLNKNTDISSWLLNTFNPVNHLPIVSSINKMVNKTAKSLDMVQSAIGGAIYGGGPMGLAKGIGGWFLNKLIPSNKLAIKPSSEKESNFTSNTLKENNKIKESSNNSSNFILPSKEKIEDRKKDLIAPNSISAIQKKKMINNLYNYQSIELKQKKNVIDTDA
jgi:hypothetical protein